MIKDKDKQSDPTPVSGVCTKCRNAVENAKRGRIMAELQRVQRDEAEKARLVRENAERVARQRLEVAKEADEREEEQMKLESAETEQRAVEEVVEKQKDEGAEANTDQKTDKNTGSEHYQLGPKYYRPEQRA